MTLLLLEGALHGDDKGFFLIVADYNALQRTIRNLFNPYFLQAGPPSGARCSTPTRCACSVPSRFPAWLLHW